VLCLSTVSYLLHACNSTALICIFTRKRGNNGLTCWHSTVLSSCSSASLCNTQTKNQHHNCMSPIAVAKHTTKLLLHISVLQLESCLNGLEERLRQYHASCHRLGLLPASAKRAAGVAYELSLNRAANAQTELLIGDIKVWRRVCATMTAQRQAHLLGGHSPDDACWPSLNAVAQRCY
jgi:hypothetical protein